MFEQKRDFKVQALEKIGHTAAHSGSRKRKLKKPPKGGKLKGLAR